MGERQNCGLCGLKGQEGTVTGGQVVSPFSNDSSGLGFLFLTRGFSITHSWLSVPPWPDFDLMTKRLPQL